MNCRCRYCGKPLNESQFRTDENGIIVLKSCPACSVLNGKEHIYYPYPSAFGTTEKRVSDPHPDGPQSYCRKCRSGSAGPHDGAVSCSSAGR